MVASGKGGVGKSNVAVNLAASLAKLDYQVGLMDADIYGPSIPSLLNIQEHPEVLPNECLMPIKAHGLKSMSIGYLVEQDKALDWRGQMTSGTILQFIQKTFWGNLDYLVIDLPPGAGDITLTIMHDIKCDGVLLVTTPSKLAIDDVRRSISLFKERQIPILGLIENMSYLTCSSCGHENKTFPHVEEHNPFTELEIECLAKIPLSNEFCRATDKGIPFVIQAPDDPISKQFFQLANKSVGLLEELSQVTEQRSAEIKQNC
jgi:ATP-binding protein involved in chromosome partitioning